jgi:hypothetical protein
LKEEKIIGKKCLLKMFGNGIVSTRLEVTLAITKVYGLFSVFSRKLSHLLEKP